LSSNTVVRGLEFIIPLILITMVLNSEDVSMGSYVHFALISLTYPLPLDILNGLRDKKISHFMF